MSPHVRRLRELVGNELLLVPSVTVLPRDDEERVLLVREADTGQWGTIGGAIEIDEAPEDAARREAEEEAGVAVEVRALLAVLAGPQFRVRYPNGDETAYVAVVYDARVTGGSPRADGDETTAVAWHGLEELAATDLSPFTRAAFDALGWL
jgi:8-oxo-dGTP pyrophosphatase MutT (NUDIX family)